MPNAQVNPEIVEDYREEKLCELILKKAVSCEKADVFVEYSAHVDQLSVRVYETGWEAGKTRDWSRDVYLGVSTSKKNLQMLLDNLQELE